MGTASVAIGAYALQNQNFTTSLASNNVAVGYYAGKEITTGRYNVLVGPQAGDAINGGDYNVALGAEALSAEVDGNVSEAIG